MRKIIDVIVSLMANIQIVAMVFLIVFLIVLAIALIKERKGITSSLAIWLVVIGIVIIGLILQIAVYHYYPELVLINSR